MSGGRPRRLALLAVYGRTGRPGARFVFGPLKPGFESSDRLASPIGSSARPCGRRCRLWARDGALRAHFFAASFGLDTASGGSARRCPSVSDSCWTPATRSRQLHAVPGEDRTLIACLRHKLRQARSLARPPSYFAWTLPTVSGVPRCLEHVVGFSFRVRPTRTRSLQDGWFGACGPDGWLHESYIGWMRATAAYPST